MIQRCNTCIDAHFGCDTVHGKALLLLNVRFVVTVKVCHLKAVKLVISNLIEHACIMVIKTRLRDNLRKVA